MSNYPKASLDTVLREVKKLAGDKDYQDVLNEVMFLVEQEKQERLEEVRNSLIANIRTLAIKLGFEKFGEFLDYADFNKL